jgi:hypothetical protein
MLLLGNAKILKYWVGKTLKMPIFARNQQRWRLPGVAKSGKNVELEKFR